MKDVKELVEALRLWAKDTEWVYSPQGADEMKQAADRIEALEAEVARLREELEAERAKSATWEEWSKSPTDI